MYDADPIRPVYDIENCRVFDGTLPAALEVAARFTERIGTYNVLAILAKDDEDAGWTVQVIYRIPRPQ